MIKKAFIPALLCLLLIVSLPVAAYADEYCSLGSYTAGEEINCFIAAIDPGAVYSADELPPGCELEAVTAGEAAYLTLSGTPTVAGSYEFTVTAGESIVCSLDICPAMPTVRVSDDLRCLPGGSVTLEAAAETGDGGALSYQWCSGAGLMAEPIPGATDRSYSVTFNETGTYLYSCEVTNTNGGQTVSVLSGPVTVTVYEPAVLSVRVETMPTKTDYMVGDLFDLTGLTLRVNYDDGSQKVVSDGFSVYPAKLDNPGTQSVRVTYEGRSCGLTVMVEKAEAKVEGIGVLTLPDKTAYKTGDSLETAGLAIRVYTDDGGHFDVSSGLDCSPTVLDKEGRQTVTVKYAEKTCTFTVTVEPSKVVTGISVLTPPDTTSYTVGDRIDTKGLSIRVNTNKGPEPVTEGFTVTPKVVTSPGTQEITVIYGQYSTKFNVTVAEAAAITPTPKPTPTPSATPAAETPEPSPSAAETPRVTSVPSTARRGPSAVVVVFLVIAVLALAGLGAYVWYLRRSGGFAAEETDTPVPPTQPKAPAPAPVPPQAAPEDDFVITIPELSEELNTPDDRPPEKKEE